MLTFSSKPSYYTLTVIPFCPFCSNFHLTENKEEGKQSKTNKDEIFPEKASFYQNFDPTYGLVLFFWYHHSLVEDKKVFGKTVFIQVKI